MSVVVSPATILKFHRHLVKRKYRQLFSSKGKKMSRKGYARETRKLVVELKQKNPDYGCLRIAQILNNLLGTGVSAQTVRRILREKTMPLDPLRSGPSWLAFFADAKDCLWSFNLFKAESISLHTYWVLAVIDGYSRKIEGYSVHQGNGENGENLCYMFNKVLGASSSSPKKISRDNDPLYKFERWGQNMEMLDIEQLVGPHYTPTANPFVERLIGTTRREFLDKTPFWTKSDLENKLVRF